MSAVLPSWIWKVKEEYKIDGIVDNSPCSHNLMIS